MRYYVNRRAQDSGDHEVHELTCSFLPDESNRIFVGNFPSCAPAVEEARRHYAQANGCLYCSRPCHTS